jgi:Kef-type K+ transport system membrane component KefB
LSSTEWCFTSLGIFFIQIHSMNIIQLFGIVLVAGFAAGRIFERLGIPRVVGFIMVGLLFGESATRIFTTSFLDSLSPVTSFALALIGFMVGGELKYPIFKKYGKQFLMILLSEGLLAMLAVAFLTTIWTGNLALGILLGALSSATAPAATVEVLWEYQARGPLTTTILAIVALDDGLALILYGFALAFSEVIVAGTSLSWNIMLLKPLAEIFGSVLLGGITGALLDFGLKYVKKKDDRLVLNLGGVMLAGGFAAYLHFSLILTVMVTGVYLTNIHPHRNEISFETIKEFTPPIYIIFFVLVGARLQLGLLPKMGMIGLLYVLGRTLGKWSGAYLGAKFSHAPESVRRYLGYALFSQAGIALGLALDIYQHFEAHGVKAANLGITVINVIAATTFLVQIIGPPSVKYAILKAGEITSDVKTAGKRIE